MSHALLALAILAACCLYPAGLSLLAAGAAAAGGMWAAAPGGRRVSWTRLDHAGSTLMGAVLLLLPLPFSGNPLFQVQPLGLATAQFGGVACSLLGIFLLRPARGEGRTAMVALGAGLGWAVLAVAFALAVRSPGWLSLVEAGGGGAAAGRIGLGLAGLVLIALWVDPNDPALDQRLRFAALVAVSLILLVPGLARGPVWLVLLAWVVVAGLGSLGHRPLAGLVAPFRSRVHRGPR